MHTELRIKIPEPRDSSPESTPDAAESLKESIDETISKIAIAIFLIPVGCFLAPILAGGVAICSAFKCVEIVCCSKAPSPKKNEDDVSFNTATASKIRENPASKQDLTLLV